MSAAIRLEASSEFRSLLSEVFVQSASYPREHVVRTALDLLDVGPEETILEIGCGSGDLLAQIAARVPRGSAVGVDPSELMLRHARMRNRHWIVRARAELRQAHSADLSVWPDACFDKVLGVHVVYFWDDPRPHLAELRRVLRRGGRLVLGFRPSDGSLGQRSAPAGAAARARIEPARVVGWLREHGFREIECIRGGDRLRPLVWLRARNDG
jgi:SAM-dependent methyltransferase